MWLLAVAILIGGLIYFEQIAILYVVAEQVGIAQRHVAVRLDVHGLVEVGGAGRVDGEERKARDVVRGKARLPGSAFGPAGEAFSRWICRKRPTIAW